MYYSKQIETPVGELTLVASDRGVVAILWEDDSPSRVKLSATQHDDHHPILCETERQLCAYFAGELQHFTLPMDARGTEFQQKVWHALTTIPFGETRSYGQIATQIGHPKAVRAVGAANGRNPLSIIAPCHRVIGSNGKLTGFAGGLAVKAFLLALENPQKS
ncbi:methylated-DNA--[protein]-cysteine S-methyltransferase [Candidatus Pantoea multigeneris]|uniref:Methylated-DNA--protein-cysteine methyltransferase n=1 Tax=Candidatus Pantoea multigeneris TaxID=2608357 RepID=A0ABX0R8J4_9GAMM|nr:methylated-DNA--[protein]-cysteine S-methyltransferase [Pantoea multigeneris]NIF20788.1 methylated-DNA--[protein]-cysteine S-methyltransferase [Pantoea multigeneris]